MNAPGGEVERDTRVEVQRAGHDHDDDRENRADPERQRDRGDGGDAPIQQDDIDEADCRDDEDHLPSGDAFPDVAEVLREADVARRDFERAAQHELPDEQEAHQASDLRGAIAVAQIAE